MNEKIVRYKGTTVVTFPKIRGGKMQSLKISLWFKKKSIVKIHKINYVLLCPGFQTG